MKGIRAGKKRRKKERNIDYDSEGLILASNTRYKCLSEILVAGDDKWDPLPTIRYHLQHRSNFSKKFSFEPHSQPWHTFF